MVDSYLERKRRNFLLSGGLSIDVHPKSGLTNAGIDLYQSPRSQTPCSDVLRGTELHTFLKSQIGIQMCEFKSFAFDWLRKIAPRRLRRATINALNNLNLE
jgi:hypothetical protein